MKVLIGDFEFDSFESPSKGEVYSVRLEDENGEDILVSIADYFIGKKVKITIEEIKE